jgi:glycosyltransferase involved in cell wall biosynthesis
MGKTLAVNTRLLLPGKMEGIGWFTFETLRRITHAHPEHRFRFLFDRPYDTKFMFESGHFGSNVEAVWMPPPTRHIRLFNPWFEWAVPFMLKRAKADMFISPDGHLSLRSSLPSVAVIHDLNFHHLPETLPPAIRNYYNTYFPQFARKATRIATVSEYTKHDIVRTYGIDASKIDVTWNGCNTAYKPLAPDEIAAVRQKYTRARPYFLFIGLIIPRKNLHRLLEAYDAFRKIHSEPIDLVVVGEKKWWDDTHEAVWQKMGYKEDVHFMGRLEPEVLGQLLASALALTYVPVFEGFGIPILEAFAAGVPVLTANVTSMPEVAGDAAVYANPLEVHSITQGLQTLAADAALRATLVKKGTERRALFSWDQTAEKLWRSIETALG